MTDHIEKAKAALESCDGWPVRDVKDMALLAIANALVAIAEGRGECRMEETHDASDRPLRFECDACGCVSLEIAPNFCPGCGRKVVER